MKMKSVKNTGSDIFIEDENDISQDDCKSYDLDNDNDDTMNILHEIGII